MPGLFDSNNAFGRAIGSAGRVFSRAMGKQDGSNVASSLRAGANVDPVSPDAATFADPTADAARLHGLPTGAQVREQINGVRILDREKPDAEVSLADLDQRRVYDDDQRIEQLLRIHGVDQDKVVTYVKGLVKSASEKRALEERDWALALAYYEDRMWVGYDDNTKRLVNLYEEEDRYKHLTVPLTAMFVNKVAAMATQNEPDAAAAALNPDDPLDVDAAAEDRALGAYTDRLFDRQMQTHERVLGCLKACASYLKICWNPHGKALVPLFDPQTQAQVGVKELPVGNVEEEIVLAFNLFLDPLAKKFDKARWCCQVDRKALSWYQERFGRRGFLVKGDGHDAGGSLVDAYLSGNAGSAAGVAGASPVGRAWGFGLGAGRNSERSNSAVCYEFWELPTPRFPGGRYIVIGGDCLLYYGPFPYKDGRLPYVPLVYDDVEGSPYGKSLASKLVSLNAHYNKALSAVITQAENQRDYMLFEQGCGITTDSFLDPPDAGFIERIGVKKGTALLPEIHRGPGIDGARFTLLETLYQRMQDIAGIHEVNKGAVPAGITAGIAIELLQQSDRTQLARLVYAIEQSMVTIREMEESRFDQFASVPMMLGLADSGNQQDANRRVMAFHARRAGGITKVVFTHGSAMPKSAAGQKQELFELYNMQIFGPVGTPGAAKGLIDALGMPNSDKIIDHIKKWQADLEANAPPPPPPPPTPEQQAALQQQTDAAKIRVQTGADLIELAAKAHLQQPLLATQYDGNALPGEGTPPRGNTFPPKPAPTAAAPSATSASVPYPGVGPLQQLEQAAMMPQSPLQGPPQGPPPMPPPDMGEGQG